MLKGKENVVLKMLYKRAKAQFEKNALKYCFI